MRTISLSSRLQWAFRGTVLPGALATGDVDNDGCNEFVVGSVQGELAVFRGRGGCGSWQHSETQVEPEYDCWDAVERGEIPSDAATRANDYINGIKRQSTYTSVTSNRESVSVDDIMHMFDGHNTHLSAATGSGESSSDEHLVSKRTSLHAWDPETTEHIRWEDALDIERDGRKPWVLAQRLGTISSVVVADISNVGHNSIVVVNGEGKCHVFDYPFKRRLHPDAAKRRRQRNHYRRFSQDRFFRDKTAVDEQREPPIVSIGDVDVQPIMSSMGGTPRPRVHRTKSAFSAALAAAAELDPVHQRNRSTSISTPAMRNLAGLQPDIASSQSAGTLALQRLAQAGDTTNSASTVTIGTLNRAKSINTEANALPVPKSPWRPASGVDGQLYDSANGFLVPGYDMASVSNVSPQADAPLTMLDGRPGRGAPAHTFGDSNPVEMNHIPNSPRGSRTITAPKQAGFSAGTGSSNGRRRPEMSDLGIDALSAVFGDADVDSDLDSGDALSDSDSADLLTADEVADIEKIWGADFGKRSGDWFPFVLERPDATFDIPTNVEHALVADIDNNGLNELVLTSTDGFVYIFRIEPRTKHMVKPTITPLGTFSNMPTALPSVNATGNGSPYLYMSAPRSPDASDLDLDDTGKHSRRQSKYANKIPASQTESRQSPIPSTPPVATPAMPVVTATTSAVVPDPHSGTESDMCTVSHLLRTIKNVSATHSEAGTGGHPLDRKAGSSSKSGDTQAALARGFLQAAAVARRQSTGRRQSLTSRMRESFSYIVAGSDVPRRPSSTFNRTAPPSLNHSRAHTANNSGSSTIAHSRRPSVSEEADSDKQNGAMTGDSDTPVFQLKTHSAAQSTPVVVTSSFAQGARGRNNTICMSALNTMSDTVNTVPNIESGGLPSIPSGELPSINESSPIADEPSQSDISKHGVSDGITVRDFEPGSRVHSRRNSLTQSIAPASRMHSRHSSISSVIGKTRILNAHHGVGSAAESLHVAGSRRGSIDSNHSAYDSSTHNNSNTSQTAEPVQAAVTARGSFSRPIQRQQPTRAESTDDNSSLISQVTERLEDLSFKAKGKLAASANMQTIAPISAAVPPPPPPPPPARRNNTFLDNLEREAASHLPPPRSVVDWPNATADKVATWFLDSIPGSVSMINAAPGMFGEPLTSRRRIVYTDNSSEYTLSSCSCSLCDNSSSNSSSSGESDGDESSEADARIGRVVGVRPIRTARNAGGGRPAAHSAAPDTELGARKYLSMANTMGPATYSGLNLPQPLVLNSIYSDRNESVKDESVKDAPEHNDDDDDDEDDDDEDDEDDGQSAGDTDTSDRQSDTEQPKSPTQLYEKATPQQFLLLSKPGGRFVPIDMVNGAILPTVIPPAVQHAYLTGGNTAHMMNVDASGSMNSYQMSMDPSMMHGSGIDLTATTGSFMCRSPSWQSESMPWVQNPPPLSFNSTGVYTKSPANIMDSELAKLPIAHHRSAFETVDSPVRRNTPDPYAQRSSFDGAQAVTGGGSPASLSQARSAAMHPDGETRKAITGASYTSMFKPGSASGAMSISNNLRSRRSLHRTSYEFLRGQQSALRLGPSPVNRGVSRSGAMTPVTAYPLGASAQYDRRQLGYAGLRGYIGGNNSHQRNSVGMLGNLRGEDGLASGYYTPLVANRGYSTGVSQGINQGLSSGTMPREPAPGYFSSVSTNASALNSGRAWADGSRLNPRSYRNLPTAPALPSASPQRAQLMQRYSPSIIGWSSYKDNSALTTIRDSEDILENEENAPEHTRPSSATAAAAAYSSRVEMSISPAQDLASRAATTSPYGEMPVSAADRAYWMHMDPASARSHSSLGTGGSAHQVLPEEKEEDIEEAPAPMEFDVATYLVGGVTPGRRYRRVPRGPCETRAAGDAEETTTSDDHLRELVSMVTMDGTISCYDPERKVNHYIDLGLSDPVLGIWKAKMHDEICNPSPLEAMLRDGCMRLDDATGARLRRSTPAKRIYRRIGLSHRDLLDAVQFSAYIEDSVHMLNRIEGKQPKHRRRRSTRARTRPVSYGTSSEKPALGAIRRRQSPRKTPRSNTLTQSSRAGLNSRLRESLGYNRVGQAVRSIGTHLRDLAVSTQPSESTALAFTPSLGVTEDDISSSFSPSQRKLSATDNVRESYDDNAGDEVEASVPQGSSHPMSVTWPDAELMRQAIGPDIKAALAGWYGRNRNDFRRNLNVSDHLIVSTWRGSTYFVDVSTLMDIAHYSELFMHRWNSSTAAAVESALASDKDGVATDAQSCSLSTIYGHLSDFSDVSGLVSRLRSNASVVQFKFQDTVSAFLSDTYAPATGGPNVPCLFYVDYKDRIWAYYHLDEIAEMDDVYGATWLLDEPARLHTPESQHRAAENGIDFINYDKPFSVIDLAYRRINMDPWIPHCDDDELFNGLITSSHTNYPYSVKSWHKPGRPAKAPEPATDGLSVDDSQKPPRSESSHTPSETSAQMPAPHVNANVTGRYHCSQVPGPYLCPIWADINSVDLYDVGACNLLELAMPELLAMKHVFCRALNISLDSVDEKTNLATIPGMANWVRSCLYFA